MSTRISALVLVVAVSVIGTPRPGSAAGDEIRASASYRALTLPQRPESTPAGDEFPAGAPRHALTLNGQPLARLLHTTTIARGTLLWGGPLKQATGQVAGVALGVDGAILAGEAVQLRHVGPPTTVVDRTTTDANGRFSFEALDAGRYIVDLHIAGRVVATSGLVSLAEGGMTFTQVGGVIARRSATADRKGKGVAFWTGVGAGAGLALGLVATANSDECDSPESLCPLVLGGMTVFGALAGLLIGL